MKKVNRGVPVERSTLNEVSGEQSPFESAGHSWAERARLGELEAVLSVGAHERINLLLHAIGHFGARVALLLTRNRGSTKGTVVDFGCGTGRFVRYFGSRGFAVIGIDISHEMLTQARGFGIPSGSEIRPTDGVSIPAPDESVDLVWVCGVLKYGLFPPGALCRGGNGAPAQDSFVPVYKEIAKEMYRVLRPGGLIVNVEMFVNAAPELFTSDFENVGFITKKVHVLRRYKGYVERLLQWHEWRRLPPKLVIAAGMFGAAVRFCLDDPKRPDSGFNDYLFVWSKPNRKL